MDCFFSSESSMVYNSASLPLKSQVYSPAEGLSVLPATIPPSHAACQASQRLFSQRETQLGLSSSLFSLWLWVRSSPQAPTPVSALLRHPVASGMSKSLRTCCPQLSANWQVYRKLRLCSPNLGEGS